MSAPKHTPLPWRTASALVMGQHSRAIVSALKGQVDIYNAPLTNETLANAEFIVRACNAHDELVAALKALMNPNGHLQARSGGCVPGPECGEYADHCRAARAALAKARGSK